MTLHNYRSRQVHETSIGVNPSSGFRDMRFAKSWPNFCQIWRVFGPWASPYGANGQLTMTGHNYRPRQFHRTSNGENPSSSYRDMGSASLAAARPPARTVTTTLLQPGGLRGKKETKWSWQWRPFRHWLHRQLSECNRVAPPVKRRLSIWRPFGFSEYVPLVVLCAHTVLKNCEYQFMYIIILRWSICPYLYSVLSAISCQTLHWCCCGLSWNPGSHLWMDGCCLR